MSVGRDIIKGANAVVGLRQDKLGRALCLEAHGRLIRKTPVDTSRARSNWNVSIDQPDFSERYAADQARATMRQARITLRRAQFSKGDALYVSNGVPYIERLEDGYSKQAPMGMVRLTLVELAPLAQRIGASLNRG